MLAVSFKGFPAFDGDALQLLLLLLGERADELGDVGQSVCVIILRLRRQARGCDAEQNDCNYFFHLFVSWRSFFDLETLVDTEKDVDIVGGVEDYVGLVLLVVDFGDELGDGVVLVLSL